MWNQWERLQGIKGVCRFRWSLENVVLLFVSFWYFYIIVSLQTNVRTLLSTLTTCILLHSGPKRIVLEGSNNFNGKVGSSKNTWMTLCDSNQHSSLSFSGRKDEETFVFTNDLNFKHYAVAFARKLDFSKLQVGSHKIVQSCAKEWSSALLEKLTSKKVPARKTLDHIRAPASTPIS